MACTLSVRLFYISKWLNQENIFGQTICLNLSFEKYGHLAMFPCQTLKTKTRQASEHRSGSQVDCLPQLLEPLETSFQSQLAGSGATQRRGQPGEGLGLFAEEGEEQAHTCLWGLGLSRAGHTKRGILSVIHVLLLYCRHLWGLHCGRTWLACGAPL